MRDPDLKKVLDTLEQLQGNVPQFLYSEEDYQKDKHTLGRMFDDFGVEMNEDSLTVFKMGVMGSIGCTPAEKSLENHAPIYLMLSVDRLIKEYEEGKN